jgi:hypothetical protein
MSLDEKDRKWIAAELAKELAKVRADIERAETSLLTEFHKWTSPWKCASDPTAWR